MLLVVFSLYLQNQYIHLLEHKIIFTLLFYIFFIRTYWVSSIISTFNNIFNIMYTSRIPEFTHTYIFFGDFIFFINQIRNKRFNLKENRDSIRSSYDDLLSKAIRVDNYSRFPKTSEFDYYIDIDNSYTSRIFEKIFNSIDISDRFLESNSEFLNNNVTSLRDASRNFQNSKNNLLKILNMPIDFYNDIGIYTRFTFEQYFNIIWSYNPKEEVKQEEDNKKLD